MVVFGMLFVYANEKGEVKREGRRLLADRVGSEQKGRVNSLPWCVLACVVDTVSYFVQGCSRTVDAWVICKIVPLYALAVFRRWVRLRESFFPS